MDGSYFGTLCALDPLPAKLSEVDFTLFHLLAKLIAYALENEEEKSRREAEISTLKDVIAIAQHDLRQPLTSLKLRAEIQIRQAKREQGSPKLLAGLEEQLVQVRRMVSLTDRLLDVGRLETGDFRLELAQLDLVELLQQVVADIRTTAPSYSFELHSPPSLMVQGDSVRLNQVVRNLLDNAVKYSPSASEPLEISVSTQASQKGKSEVLVTVQDRGMGVQENDLGHLFERQYRTNEASQAGINGSGFGLFIARQIIEAHDGQIWATSRNEGGLTLSFTLPLP